MTYRDHAGIVGGNRVISVPCGEKIFSCPVSKNCHISDKGRLSPAPAWKYDNFSAPRAEKYYFKYYGFSKTLGKFSLIY